MYLPEVGQFFLQAVFGGHLGFFGYFSYFPYIFVINKVRNMEFSPFSSFGLCSHIMEKNIQFSWKKFPSMNKQNWKICIFGVFFIFFSTLIVCIDLTYEGKSFIFYQKLSTTFIFHLTLKKSFRTKNLHQDDVFCDHPWNFQESPLKMKNQSFTQILACDISN